MSIELIKVASGVNKNGPLKGLLGEWVIADGIVGEVVDQFKGQDVARPRNKLVPIEYAFVYYLDMRGMAAGGSSSPKL